MTTEEINVVEGGVRGNVEEAQKIAINTDQLLNANDLHFLKDVEIALTIEVGRAEIKIKDLLNLSKDSIIELDKKAGEPVDIFANGKLISRGNIITVNGKYFVRLTATVNPESGETA